MNTLLLLYLCGLHVYLAQMARRVRENEGLVTDLVNIMLKIADGKGANDIAEKKG